MRVLIVNVAPTLSANSLSATVDDSIESPHVS